jgi:hypothetical protein
MSALVSIYMCLEQTHSTQVADRVQTWDRRADASNLLDLPHRHGVAPEVGVAHRRARSHIPYSQPVVFTRRCNSADIVLVPVAAEHLGRASLGAATSAGQS